MASIGAELFKERALKEGKVFTLLHWRSSKKEKKKKERNSAKAKAKEFTSLSEFTGEYVNSQR